MLANVHCPSKVEAVLPCPPFNGLSYLLAWYAPQETDTLPSPFSEEQIFHCFQAAVLFSFVARFFAYKRATESKDRVVIRNVELCKICLFVCLLFVFVAFLVWCLSLCPCLYFFLFPCTLLYLFTTSFLLSFECSFIFVSCCCSNCLLYFTIECMFYLLSKGLLSPSPLPPPPPPPPLAHSVFSYSEYLII